MTEPEKSLELRISDDERHAVAELLRTAAGEGRLDLDELDERLEATYAARTYADLVPITIDLPSASTPTRTQPSSAVVSAADSKERHFAIMSGFDRKGVWTVPATMSVTCFMGGAELDMREATFAAQEVVVTVNAVMGGVGIIVGPGVNVVMEGIGIMGGYSGPSGLVEAELTPDSPTLRVRGVAIMGGVGVERKHGGSSDKKKPHQLH